MAKITANTTMTATHIHWNATMSLPAISNTLLPMKLMTKMPTGAQMDQMAMARPRVASGNHTDTQVGPATMVVARATPRMKRPTRNA